MLVVDEASGFKKVLCGRGLQHIGIAVAVGITAVDGDFFTPLVAVIGADGICGADSVV